MNQALRMAGLAGAGALAIGAAVMGANLLGVAHADNGNGAFSGPEGDRDAGAFWVDVDPVLSGWSVSKDRELANMVCSQLEAGESEGALTAEVAKGDDGGIRGITYVIHAAEWHFCPDQY